MAALSLAASLAAVVGAIMFAPIPRRGSDDSPQVDAYISTQTLPSPTPRRTRPETTRKESASFPVADYLAALAGVRSTVCILDTFPLPHTLRPAFRQTYLDGLRIALEGGASVRILLLHARSAVIGDRIGPALGQLITPERYQQHIHTAMADLHTLRESLPPDRRAALQIRLTDAFPGVTCYQLDNVVLTAFYPPDRLASQAPHAWVPQDSAIGKFARRRFDNLWEHAEDLDVPRHLFCEVRLPTPDPAGRPRVYPRTRFVERGNRVYICFDSPTLRDRAFDERFLYALLPDPAPEAAVPMRYTVTQVQDAMMRAIRKDFEAKYQDQECPWGIGELLATA